MRRENLKWGAMVSSSDPPPGGSAPRRGGGADLEKVQRSLPIALLMAREAVMARFRPMLARHDINEQQWRVLRVLGQYGELDATELAARSLVLGPSLTRMIKTLEKRKLVAKRKDSEDGRRALLALAPKARALIQDITPESLAIYEEIEGCIGRHESERLLDLLDSLSKRLAG
jgi:homoprotocatechuate degradation regulator HpaR